MSGLVVRAVLVNALSIGALVCSSAWPYADVAASDEVLGRVTEPGFMLLYESDGTLLSVWSPGRGSPESSPNEASRGGPDQRALGAALSSLVNDENPDARQDAVRTLESLGGRAAIAALTAAVVQDRDASVRQRAIEALGEVGGAAVRELLSWALRADEDPFVRYQALVGLAAIGDETAMALARHGLDDPHKLIRSKAEELVDVHEREAER